MDHARRILARTEFPERMWRVTANLFFVLLSGCVSPVSDAGVTFRIPSTSDRDVRVIDQCPDTNSFSEYDNGKFHLYVWTRRLPEVNADQGDRKKTLSKFMSSDFGLPSESSRPRNKLDVVYRRPVHSGSMDGEEVAYATLDGRPPNIYRVLVGNSYLSVLFVSTEDDQLRSEDISGFLDSLQFQEVG